MESTTVQINDLFQRAAVAGGTGGRSWKNRVLNVICVGLAFLALIPLISIIFLLLQKGLPLLSWDAFTQLTPAPGMTGGGMGNAIVGTLLMVAIGLAISAPFGILSAIYVNEYSPNSALAHTVRFVAKLLTGIPSIICGVFAYAVVVIGTGFSAWAGGFALAILCLPTIFLTAEQALIGVPKAYREASYGLGGTTFQTIWRIVLPDAFPAIMTGLMLALARAAGETAPLLFTALSSPYWLHTIKEPTASLSVFIFNASTGADNHLINLAWTASLILVLLVTIANITAQVVFRKK